MTIDLNGNDYDTKKNTSIAELLVQLELNEAQGVGVELNGEFVKKEDYDTILEHGDRVEVVHFLGGG